MDAGTKRNVFSSMNQRAYNLGAKRHTRVIREFKRQVAANNTDWYLAISVVKYTGRRTNHTKNVVDTETKMYDASLKFSGSFLVKNP